MELRDTKENYIYKCNRKHDDYWHNDVFIVIEKRGYDCVLKHLDGHFRKVDTVDSVDYGSIIGKSEFIELGHKDEYPEYFI